MHSLILRDNGNWIIINDKILIRLIQLGHVITWIRTSDPILKRFTCKYEKIADDNFSFENAYKNKSILITPNIKIQYLIC